MNYLSNNNGCSFKIYKILIQIYYRKTSNDIFQTMIKINKIQLRLIYSLIPSIRMILNCVFRIYQHNKKNYLYYKDSKLFSELKIVLDDLIKSFISEVVINSASVPVLYTDQKQEQINVYVYNYSGINNFPTFPTIFLKLL